VAVGQNTYNMWHIGLKLPSKTTQSATHSH
jgi:hypothetical protein